MESWALSQYKDCLTRYRLIFNMRIPILVRWHLYIETPLPPQCSAEPPVQQSQTGKIMVQTGKKLCYHIGIACVTCPNLLETGIRMGAKKSLGRTLPTPTNPNLPPVSWPSCPYNGNYYTLKDSLYIETEPFFPKSRQRNTVGCHFNAVQYNINGFAQDCCNSRATAIEILQSHAKYFRGSQLS